MSIRPVGGSSKSDAPVASAAKKKIDPTGAAASAFVEQTLAAAQVQIALAAQSVPNPDLGAPPPSGIDAIAGVAAAFNAAPANSEPATDGRTTPER